MTYKEREIARLEGMKDGLIKKLVDDCNEINDQITALRNGTPKKKDSQIYYDRGYKQGKSDERARVEQMLSELPTINGYIDSAWLWQKWEQLKENKNDKR